MEFNDISKVPIGERVVLYWDKSKHLEDGTVYIDEESESGARYHVLYDGEALNDAPSHFALIPNGF